MKATAADLYNKGRDFLEEKRWKNAIQYFSRAIKLDPVFSDAYFKRGKAYCEQEEPDYPLAIHDFNKAIHLEPGSARAYGARARAYYMVGKHSLAISDCNRSLRIEPEYYYLYLLRGESYLRVGSGSSDEYQKDMDQAAGNFELDVESILPTGEAGSASGKNIRPLQPCAEFHISIDQDSYKNQAWETGCGAYCAALEDISRAILLEPDYSYAYWCRGNVYLDNSLFDSAIVEYTEAIRTALEENPEPYFSRAMAYYRKGWFDQAIRDYNQAIARDGNRGEFYWWRGEAWESKGEYEKARGDFENAQRLGYCEEEGD